MQWVSGNRYLNQTEMENNVTILTLIFREWGWTDESIAGMVGNMQTESTVNPGIWQDLTVGSGGYGLVQWTPYTNYSDWAGDGWQDNGQKECERIKYELDNGLQWIPTTEYPATFADYVVSTDPPRALADVWLKNYERPKDTDQPIRGEQAEQWYPFIKAVRSRPRNLWMFFKLANVMRRM